MTFRHWINSIAVFSALVIFLFPDPMNGCGPDEDPWDYYTSFFQKGLESHLGYQPFYYTGLRFLYNEQDEIPLERVTSTEWASHLGASVTADDAYTFICTYNDTTLRKILTAIQKHSLSSLPDSVINNSLTKHLFDSKDLQPLKYFIFLNSLQPYVVSSWDATGNANDSAAMGKLIKISERSIPAEHDAFLQNRYAYQALRLAFYSNNYKRTEYLYNKYFKQTSLKTTIDLLALSIKAGLLYREHKKSEAAYLYSLAFAANPTKKISNYLSFTWSINAETSQEEYFSYCKDTREAANMMSMFAFHNPGSALDQIQKIGDFDAACPALEVLATREINKIEEQFLSRKLAKNRGGIQLFYNYDSYSDDSLPAIGKQVDATANYFHDLSQNPKAANPALFEIGAAYLAYMNEHYDVAEKYLANASKMKMSQALADQMQLTSLLITINRQNQLDETFEAKILPSIQWLETKAKQSQTWKQFYRDLFSSIIAPRYLVEGRSHKMLLAIGSAEYISGYNSDQGWYFNRGESIRILHSGLSTNELLDLNTFVTSSKLSKFDQYLLAKNAITINDISDAIGTSYLRRHDWADAIVWMKKLPSNYYDNDYYKQWLGANSLAEKLLDTHSPDEQDTVRYTKITFAQTMLKLEELIHTSKSNDEKASLYYSLANGCYSMTYWGNSWALCDDSWASGEHPNTDSLDIGNWKREYYGAYHSEDLFNKAFALSNDNNFKAKCLFMAAKCDQKQHFIDSYDYYGYSINETKDEQQREAMRRFVYNPTYFPALLKEYEQTPFFQEAVNTCSYLADFVKYQRQK